MMTGPFELEALPLGLSLTVLCRFLRDFVDRVVSDAGMGAVVGRTMGDV